MSTNQPNQAVIAESLSIANAHYENFPVASVILPKHLREPIGLIYRFARQADDFADEGDLTVDERLNLLNSFREELTLLQAYIKPQTVFFFTLGEMIKSKKLPYTPFFDLLNAFSQDVTKTRYANYSEVLNYCSQSANPVGRLMLCLYQQSNEQNNRYSDAICTALQLINFLQDIAIDFKKNEAKQRIYMCLDELKAFKLSEADIGDFTLKLKPIDENWQQFMHFNLKRVSDLLQSGKPLGRILSGRIGFEMRMIIAGGERIIHKIRQANGDVFNHRPILHINDWLIIFFNALFKR